MNRLGGRGKCPYCKQFENNVAYHQVWECPKRPRELTGEELAKRFEKNDKKGSRT